MNPSSPPTIEHIAAHLGVSVSTVSRALRGDRRISRPTTDRVRAAAEQLGYRPNPLISALMAHLRTTKPPQFQCTIAYLDTSVKPDETRNWPSSQEHYKSVHARALQLGYGIGRFWFYDPEVSSRQLVKIMVSRGIQGLIVHYLPTVENRLHELPMELSPFAVAALGAKVDTPSIHYSCTDHYAVMQLALAQLQNLGYRRIGVVMDAYVDNIVEGRFLGAYLKWEESIPVKNRVAHAVTPHFSEKTFAQWFCATKPDAIICIDDQVVTWLREMKVAIPERVGVVHLDVSDEHTGMSGVRQRHDVVGSSTVDLIVGQLHRNERGVPETPKAVLIGGDWVPGETVRKN